MKKIKKRLLLLIGLFLSFTVDSSRVLAQFKPGSVQEMYGPGLLREPTLPQKIVGTILSPIFLILIAHLVVVVGVVIFVKKMRKNKKIKKNINLKK